MYRLADPRLALRMDDLSSTLTIVATVGSGLAGGVFFAFSSFVMPALRRLPPAQGIAAMQSINQTAPSPLFMIPLLGTVLLGAALAVSAFRDLSGPAAPFRLAGATLYLIAIILTVAYHVPHNDALAQLDPNAEGSTAAWRAFYSGWTAWNLVRTVCSLAACVAYALALRAP